MDAKTYNALFQFTLYTIQNSNQLLISIVSCSKYQALPNDISMS